MSENDKAEVPKKDERVYYRKTHDTAGRVAGGVGAAILGKPVIKYFHDLAASKAGGKGPKGGKYPKVPFDKLKRPFAARGAGLVGLIASAAPFAVAGSAVGANIQREARESSERKKILKAMIAEGKNKPSKTKKAHVSVEEPQMVDIRYLYFVKEAVNMAAPSEFKEGRAWSTLGRGIDSPCQYHEDLTFIPHTKTAKVGKWFSDLFGGATRSAAKTLDKAKANKAAVYKQTAQSQKAHEAKLREAASRGPNWLERNIPSLFKQKSKKERVAEAAAKMKKSKSFQRTQKKRQEAKELAGAAAADYRAASAATSKARRQAAVGGGVLAVGGVGTAALKRKARRRREAQAGEYS